MKKKIWILELWGFALTSLFGTLLHFLYEWSGSSLWVAPFSGVNESTFEHMKLLFWPMLILAVLGRLFYREREDYWCVKLRGTLLGLFLIPALFYTYNGAIGQSPDWINIAIFFISAAIAYIYQAKAFYSDNVKCRFPRLSIVIFLLIGGLFVLFTFMTPELPLFLDPLTKTYGI